MKKRGVALLAGVLAFSLMASTAQAGGWGGHHGGGGHGYSGHSYGGHYGGGYYGGGYGHHYYGHNNGLAVAAGITGALFGIAAIADAVTPGYGYYGPPAVYQAPPAYYYPAPRVYYYPPPAYIGPPAYYGPRY